ncbi:unnamed protein product [Cuscuta campestris]|uniref:Uncharacterized protein n=1 Tax=Cuscuta campestris TaxID=132261 RepID=A0A484K4Q5_9ASTE|nr:unnamed protein product [Cuscuta campestris]
MYRTELNGRSGIWGRSNVPTTSHVGGEEIAPGSGNGTGGIASTPDAVQALFGLGVTTEQLQTAIAALSAMGGNVPGAGPGKAPLGHHTEHAATSQHKGKKTRRSRRRPDKGSVIEEVLVEDVQEGEDDESSECRVSAFKRLGGEETRVSAFDRLNRGPEGRLGDLRRQISEGRRRNAEESATSDARSARPERTEGRRDEQTQRHQSPTRTEKTKVPERGMTELAREIAELKRRVETKSPYSQPILRTVTPFTPRVMSVPLPANFRPWQIKAYSGTTDPQDHLSKFYASMEAAIAPDEVKCRCFLATLEGSACDWFNRLPKGTIDDWDTLAEKFLTHFAANRRQRLPYSHLLNICIHKGEKVRDFIVRWEKETRDVHGADDQALVAMFQAALPRGEVRKELRKNPPPTYQETLAHAKFLASEEFDDAQESEAAPAKRAPADSGETAKKRKKKKDYTAGPRTPLAGRLIARGPPPRDDAATPSRGPPEGRTWMKPTKPVAVATQARNPEKRHIGRECDDLNENEAQGYPVGFIHGGNIGGDSTAQRKRWKHMAFVAKVHQAPPLKLGRREQIQFTEKDLPNTPSPHRDALVVKIEINDAIVHRTLVDTGSSVNIMYEKTFQDLGLNCKDLRPVRTPLSGFTGDPKIICHRLAVNPESRPVKQKKRFLSSEWREFVSKEEPSPALETDDWWTVFTDGSSAAKNSGGGVVVIAPEGFRAYYSVRFGFKASNNEAEYEALLCGLRVAVGMNATKLRIKCDSKLVVGHVSGEFEAKDERMKKYRDTALELLKSFTAYSVEQIPRAENAEADILSKLSSNTPEHIRRMANVEELSKPNIHAFPVAMICAQPRDWTDDIVAFLKDGTLPNEAVKAKLVRTRAPGYTLEGEKLYKQAYNGTLLRCLRPGEAKQVMEEVHAGICSAHQGAYAVSRKITLQGFLWPTIVKDCAEFVKKCKVCQEFQKVPGRPSTNYTPISTAIPFARWGLDLVGALPRGTGNLRYIIVAIDYFTKWVEAAPLASITGAQCQKFLAKQGIKHSYALVGYPQTNGQVENANRTIVDELKRKLEACGGEWAEELPYILWTYRTTPRRATGETPFALCYGFEARAPAEISIATHQEEVFDPERNEEALAAELHLVHERREAAFIRAENYRKKVKSYHDGRVHARRFIEGEWVLRKRYVSRPLEGGKFAKNYEGPYIIKEVVGPSTFRL